MKCTRFGRSDATAQFRMKRRGQGLAWGVIVHIQLIVGVAIRHVPIHI